MEPKFNRESISSWRFVCSSINYCGLSMHTCRVLAIAAVIIFLLAATLVRSGGYFHIYIDNINCVAPGVGIFVVAMSLFKIVVCLGIASYVLL